MGRRGLVVTPHKPLQPTRRRAETVQGGVIAAALMLLIVLGGSVQMALTHEYRSEAQSVLGEIERSAQKLASRTTEVFDRVDQTLLVVKYLQERGSPDTLPVLHRAGVLAGDVIRAIAITDARGRVIDSSAGDVTFDFSKDPEFARHRDHADAGASIGQTATSPLAERGAIPVMRRLNGPGGFAGVVVALVEPATLSAQNVKTEAVDTAIGVVGLDGVFRSRQLGGRVASGLKIDLAGVDARTRKVRQTLEPMVTNADPAPRFVTNVRVERYPLLAVVAVNAHTALAGYRHTRDLLLGGAALVGSMIVLGAALLWLRVREIVASRDRTRRAEAAFRATLEGSLDAVSILRAQRRADGTLEDLIVVDTNERAAALHGGTVEFTLGRGLCEMRPSVRREGYLARFETAISRREVINFEQQAVDPEVTGRWLHHQVVPLGDGIALITRDVTERKQAEQTLATLARTDPLTRLGNRRDFEQRLREARARALRSGQTLALVYVDLDGFKLVNDTLGHAAGDQVLVGVAARLVDCVRTTDTVCRLGGDEFVALLENAGRPIDVKTLCDRILAALSQPHALDAGEVRCTPSIGAAILRQQEALEALVRRADAAMYGAKQAGKCRYQIDSEFAPLD